MKTRSYLIDFTIYTHVDGCHSYSGGRRFVQAADYESALVKLRATIKQECNGEVQDPSNPITI